MKWKQNRWPLLLSFLIGALVSFIASQFSLFDINFEIDVVSLFLGLLTLVVALHIADTIQPKNNRNQNRYIYMENKLDESWTNFNNLSKVISVDDKISGEVLAKINKDIIHQVSFLKNIFDGYNIDGTCISELESKLDDFESLFDELPTENNVKYYKDKKEIIESNIVNINHTFSVVLNKIQHLD